MKIQKIHVHNFKAISDQEANFNGCSAIITGGNDSGKSSLLRGLIDRFHSEKPDFIVKQSEDKGYNVMELTDGSVIQWKFTEKSESFSYTTKDGVKQTNGVLGAIGKKYFGRKFDINSFLNSTPKQQSNELQKIVGLDFSEIDSRYKQAYDDRSNANRELKRLMALGLTSPDKVEKPQIDIIKDELIKARDQNKLNNDKLLKVKELTKIREQISGIIKGTEIELSYNDAVAEKVILTMSSDIEAELDINEIEKRLDDAQLQLRKYDSYERDNNDFTIWNEDIKSAKDISAKMDKKVKDIEEEKANMILMAKMPEGFNIQDDGITYNGFPLSDNQISSSEKYIAALKLGSMLLGEVKALHFDASYLDNQKLKKVQAWADSNDLQLLIERPDLDGGDIKYEIIEK